MVTWTGKRIAKINLFSEAASPTLFKIGYEHFVFAAAYAVCLYYCYATLGEQHLEALTMYEEQDINVIDDFERLRKKADDFLAGKIPTDPFTSASTVNTSPTYVIPSKWSPGFWPSIALGVVATLHALFFLGQKWSVRFLCMVRYRAAKNASSASHVHVIPAAHQGKEQLVPIQRTKDGALYFDFQRRKYLYDAELDSFVKVKCRSDYFVEHYTAWGGIRSDVMYDQLKELYGSNRFQMASPAFMDLYWEQMTEPFTVFQIFSTALWCLDSYWQYSLFSFFMIFVFQGTTVFSRQRSLGVIKSMGNEVAPVMVYRNKTWKVVTTEDLVPGDLFSLVKGRPAGEGAPASESSDVIPCDAILVAGGAVVNESTLTGESIPQMKDGIILSNGVAPAAPTGAAEESTGEGTVAGELPKGPAGTEAGSKIRVNMKGLHKINTLFGGTRVLQVSSVATKTEEEKEDIHDSMAATSSAAAAGELSITQQYARRIPPPPDDGCICYCIRTGFCSSQGKLVRLIETSQTTTVHGDTTDTVLLLLFLLVFALIASGYVLYRGMEDGTRSRYQLLLHCILIVTSVIPPELPMQTALAVNNSLMTLMKMQMFCTEPFRVPMAGKIDTCVFDKTGTLTTDELVAVGIVPPSTRIADLETAFAAAMKKVEEQVNKEKPAPVAPAAKQKTLFGIPIGPPVPPQGGASIAGIPIIRDTVSVAGAGMHSMVKDLHITAEAVAVLGACHSLVLIDGKVGGDPLEEAALKAVRWEVHPTMKDVVRPAPHTVADKPFELRVPSVVGGSSSYGAKLVQLEHIKIVARHHFSSKLQRMSVVARIAGGAEGGMILVKGSPEAIAAMCTTVPSDFAEVSNNLARRGMRVIALAWRRVTNEQITACCESRLEVEKDLIFVGFVAFMCRVRKDSADVVHQLRCGGNAVAMATGDAVLTGVHVAKEVGITTSSKKGILLLELPDEVDVAAALAAKEKAATASKSKVDDEAAAKNLKWVDFDSGKPFCPPGSTSPVVFNSKELSKLAKDYDLCVAGRTITYALDHVPSVAAHLHEFVVYARMRPDEKERVLVLMKEQGRVTLMCGDGANDVGALRQAHVGIALLTGFGDLNGVKDGKGDAPAAPAPGTGAIANGPASPAPTESALDAKFGAMTITETDEQLMQFPVAEIHRRMRLIGTDPSDYPDATDRRQVVALYRKLAGQKAEEHKDVIRQRRLMKMTPQQRNAELAKENQENIKKKQLEFQQELERLTAAGDSWAMVTAMKNMWAKEQENAKKIREKNAKNMSLQGSAGNLAKMMEGQGGLEGMEDLEQPMIKIGDASVASPFTSKMPSIRGAVDVIRQGRCTLVTTIQMYQILALNCLINAYSLSALHLDGIKYGDKQLTCLGMLMSVSFISISRSQPLDKLSPIKPLKSVFHPAYFLSLCGQFALHLGTMYFLVQESKKYLPEDYKPDLDGVFHQNIINSVVFLVTAVQQVSVFVVNLKGPPYMGGLGQNAPLLYSLVITFLGVFMCASESVPQVNKWLQLEPFPTPAFRNMVLAVLAVDVVFAYLWDRFLLGVFAYPVLQASLKATTKQEMMMIIRVVLFVAAVMYYFVNQDFTEFWEEYERQMNETLAAEEAEALGGTAASLSKAAPAGSVSGSGDSWFGGGGGGAGDGNFFEQTLNGGGHGGAMQDL